MFLDRIVATKQQEVERLKEHFSVAKAEREIAALPACRGFRRALVAEKNRPMGLIAEVKKASPSKGLIRADFDPAAIARAYAQAKADCLSVLTDEPYFQGANAYLQLVRKAVDLPILRKDFTIDMRQIYEARLLGADAVLLIVAILTDDQLREFLDIAHALGLDALVEVHDLPELERALSVGADLVGINNRDLRTFVTDLATTEQLIRHIPKDKAIISESGISGNADINRLLQFGVDAVLVGEHLMRQDDIELAVHELMDAKAAKGAE
ncbi:MAG TPA: indole-3-glycerol phosphate synthase TrpC [Bacilli bacterium]